MTLLTDASGAGQSTMPSPPGNTPQRGWFQAFLLRLHFYAGILTGPFLLVAAVTGGLYALTPQLEHALYTKELHVPAVTDPVPLSAQVRSAVDHTGGGENPIGVRPAPGSEDTTRVLFADQSLGESEYRTVFVDPGTAEIRGDLPTYGSSGALPLRSWISNLHRSLNLGEPGRLYSELAASWLWVIALGGLLLWVARLRRQPRKNNRHPSGRARILRLHGITGAVMLAGFVFLSASGLSWSAAAGENITTLRAALGWQTPTISTNLATPDAPAPTHDHHAGHTPTAPVPAAGGTDFGMYDRVLQTAREDIITAPMIDIKPSAKPGTAWTVTEAGREWPASASTVAIDPATSQITDRVNFDTDYSPAAKLTRWVIAAHMGLLFGLPNQLALLVLATGLAAMVIWGYVMWWKRRPTRGSAWAVGRPAPRGGLRRAHWTGITAVAAVALTLGIFLPLLGWSLLAFIMLDGAVAAVKRRCAKPASGQEASR